MRSHRLANRLGTAILIHKMSGVFFEYPGVRFSRRFQLLQVIVRLCASVRRLTHAARHRFRSSFRRKTAEFPTHAQTADKRLGWTSRGSRAAVRASSDALRPNHNSVKNEDHYDISWKRKRLATSAGRLPQKGRRRSPRPAELARESAGEEVVFRDDRRYDQRAVRRQLKSADHASACEPRRDDAKWLAFRAAASTGALAAQT